MLVAGRYGDATQPKALAISSPAPVAFGWSGCQVDLHPPESVRLLTAHASSGYAWAEEIRGWRTHA
jgi:hypothetical protein